MEKIVARVVSVHAGSNDDLCKEEHPAIQVELDGVVGDRHQSFARAAWQGDKQSKGTIRRNERQWSAVSVEELAEIQDAMDLGATLTAYPPGRIHWGLLIAESVIRWRRCACAGRCPERFLFARASGYTAVLAQFLFVVNFRP